jgi:hypothetical protein
VLLFDFATFVTVAAVEATIRGRPTFVLRGLNELPASW